MYTPQHVKDISAQFNRRAALMAIPTLFFIAAIVYSIAQRIQWLTIFLFIAMCFVILFYWGLFLSPLQKYKKHLISVLYGQNRTTEGYFKHFLQESSDRDGVLFVPLYINISNTHDEEDDRLFYYDYNLPLPDWKEGEKLSITSQDKAVVSWKRM